MYRQEIIQKTKTVFSLANFACLISVRLLLRTEVKIMVHETENGYCYEEVIEILVATADLNNFDEIQKSAECVFGVNDYPIEINSTR